MGRGMPRISPQMNSITAVSGRGQQIPAYHQLHSPRPPLVNSRLEQIWTLGKSGNCPQKWDRNELKLKMCFHKTCKKWSQTEKNYSFVSCYNPGIESDFRRYSQTENLTTKAERRCTKGACGHPTTVLCPYRLALCPVLR